MAKTPTKKSRDKEVSDADLRYPAHEIVPSEIIQADRLEIELRKINEIKEHLFLPSGIDEDQRKVRVRRALELYESLKPGDGIEGMLAAQMVGTHHAALECLRRAALEEQSFEGRDMALKHAQKLMTLYTQQVAALNKHRGKGQQKVTVEHVHVEAGGQAIVGNVEAGRADTSTKPPQIESFEDIPLEINPKKPQKIPRKKPNQT